LYTVCLLIAKRNNTSVGIFWKICWLLVGHVSGLRTSGCPSERRMTVEHAKGNDSLWQHDYCSLISYYIQY